MRIMPTSRSARRRLKLLAVATPVLAIAVALTLYGLRGSISYFYTPSQAYTAGVPNGRGIELGGLVENGSVRRDPDGEVRFVVRDHAAAAEVIYRGELPDLFREGQGVVANGAFESSGVFIASQILAKHDERYIPRELVRALKARGEWRANSHVASQAANDQTMTPGNSTASLTER